ncbi:hypothetical protein GCM10009753_44260 [Streptantibioticus ferralitis]
MAGDADGRGEAVARDDADEIVRVEELVARVAATTTSTAPTIPGASYHLRLTNSPPRCMTSTPARRYAPGSSVA